MKTTGSEMAKKRLEYGLERVRNIRLAEHWGRVSQVVGLTIESEGPQAGLGGVCRIQTQQGNSSLAEVVGFRDRKPLLMALGQVQGIKPGDKVISLGSALRIPVGEALKGRVIDSLGEPLDGLGPIRCREYVSIHASSPHPLKRQRISKPFETGIKALDTFVPFGRGQRLGIFAGSGIGKSTLLGMIASDAEADVNVIGLIGERGREVREFLEKDLTAEGRAKSVVVVATSSQPPLARVKGAFTAMAVAEYFRDAGQNVFLMMDSVTRFALAQREIGLSVGEPPATRGYAPSVFSMLPQLLERAGTSEWGAITGLFTVLVEGDDMNEPIADAVRSILDGHIVMTRELATRNHYPAIDILESLSRLSRELTTPQQQQLAAEAREALALYRKNTDLINIGAYPGGNPKLDRAIQLHEPLNEFLRQSREQRVGRNESWSLLAKTMAPAPAPAPASEKPKSSR